ncbi:MAG: hypothetical protein EXR72_11980 [Myxococcales bacterium]|nr:hypothetical protein [Myxococcales bacterium]
MTVSGRRLAEGETVLVGVTDDGWVVFIDFNDQARPVARAVPLSGGPVQAIVANTDQFKSFVLGRTVVVWHDTDGDGNGVLGAWRAGVYKEFAKRSPVAGAVSRDGAYIAYYDNVDADTTFADLVFDRTDHSAPKVVQKRVGLGANNCIPIVDIVGNHLVASHCPPEGGKAAVTSWDPAGKRVDLLLDAVSFWVADIAGTMVLVVNQAGVGSVVPIGGGAPLISNLAEIYDARFTHDGSAVLYATTKGALVRAPVKGAPITLQAKGVLDFNALSIDDRFVIYHGKTGASFSDLFLASATGPSVPITLSATPDAATNGSFGNTFTADSSRALYFTGCDEKDWAGTLRVQSVVGGPSRAIAERSSNLLRARGTRIVFTEDYEATLEGVARADIKWIDLAQGAATLIAQRADPGFSVTPDGKSVVYAYTTDPERAGIYLAPLAE